MSDTGMQPRPSPPPRTSSMIWTSFKPASPLPSPRRLSNVQLSAPSIPSPLRHSLSLPNLADLEEIARTSSSASSSSHDRQDSTSNHPPSPDAVHPPWLVPAAAAPPSLTHGPPNPKKEAGVFNSRRAAREMSLRRVVSDRSLRREVDRVLVERQRFYEVARVPQPIAESVAEGRPSSTFSVAYSCSSSESDDEMDRETEKKEMAPVREKGDGFMKSVLKRFKGRRARSVDVGGTAVTKDSRRRSLAGCKETLKVGTDVKEDEMISKDEEKAGMGVLGDEVSADGTLSGDKTVVPSEEDVAIWAASDEKPFAPDAELLKSPSSPSGGLKARWSARWRTSFGALPRGGAATLSANLSSLSLDEVEAVEREEGLAAIDVAPAPKAVGSRFISMLKSRRRT